ncbi:hypothetical protein ACFWPA_02560 [Rhodococcus sp. NPDC058505]|uniref:hypothetical protein n=1 Tax=unclassified Rhodococcus (in: high G+C Gram-positive bacteria) TaxID=192944 RepID=UPI00365109E5
MQQWPSEWPRPAKGIASAIDAAVTAAGAADAPAFGAATTELLRWEPDQVRAVLSAMVRALLEDVHPDGLTGEAVQAVLERSARAAAGWLPTLDVGALAVVLTGSLGLTDYDEDTERIGWPVIAPHALLVTADLLAAAQTPADRHLRRAIGEIARAETVEMP